MARASKGNTMGSCGPKLKLVTPKCKVHVHSIFYIANNI
jgi:hypothetical protein